MAFCGAVAASSVQRNVWVRSQSQQWWDSDLEANFCATKLQPDYIQLCKTPECKGSYMKKLCLWDSSLKG
ncbi:hypothetical protein ATANTOWER_010744 [Ataeniobius toweri]|uniref:Uncharacterized protein n=1 Tax=Ataeniobius toweri TaxID=208326 RepID=A0ABU7A6V2_9TELE|nr:hypothetical protein [Ataeniobius toweri]